MEKHPIVSGSLIKSLNDRHNISKYEFQNTLNVVALCTKILIDNGKPPFPDRAMSSLRTNGGGLPNFTPHMIKTLNKKKLSDLIREEIERRLNQIVFECSIQKYSPKTFLRLVMDMIITDALTGGLDNQTDPVWKFWGLHIGQSGINIEKLVSMITIYIYNIEAKDCFNLPSHISIESFIRLFLGRLEKLLVTNSELSQSIQSNIHQEVNEILSALMKGSNNNESDEYLKATHTNLKCQIGEFKMLVKLFSNINLIKKSLLDFYNENNLKGILESKLEQIDWMTTPCPQITNRSLMIDDPPHHFWELCHQIKRLKYYKQHPVFKRFNIIYADQVLSGIRYTEFEKMRHTIAIEKFKIEGDSSIPSNSYKFSLSCININKYYKTARNNLVIIL